MANKMSGAPDVLDRRVLVDGFFHEIRTGLISRTDHLEDWFGWLFQVGAFPSHQEATQ